MKNLTIFGMLLLLTACADNNATPIAHSEIRSGGGNYAGVSLQGGETQVYGSVGVEAQHQRHGTSLR